MITLEDIEKLRKLNDELIELHHTQVNQLKAEIYDLQQERYELRKQVCLLTHFK